MPEMKIPKPEAKPKPTMEEDEEDKDLENEGSLRRRRSKRGGSSGGHINHSEKVMRVITRNRSFKGMPSVDDGKDDSDSDEQDTHAAVLMSLEILGHFPVS
ncbi:hypothetical protein HN51_042763 [Arachis hypogaea]